MPVIRLVAARFPFTRTTQADHGEQGDPAEHGKDAVKGGSDNYTNVAFGFDQPGRCRVRGSELRP
jgi:hypothetical protein